ncbi:hypothetical protein ACFYY8_17745 [Streptosporangium sp. NPDC001559]
MCSSPPGSSPFEKSRQELARDLCHGKRGLIRQAYRDGMEETGSAWS